MPLSRAITAKVTQICQHGQSTIRYKLIGSIEEGQAAIAKAACYFNPETEEQAQELIELSTTEIDKLAEAAYSEAFEVKTFFMDDIDKAKGFYNHPSEALNPVKVQPIAPQVIDVDPFEDKPKPIITGDKLQARMKIKEVSIVDVAELLGVQVKTVENWLETEVPASRFDDVKGLLK